MKILLVEDERYTAEFLAATLTAHRYTVDIATDGPTGLELALQWEYDLIVLDVLMPGLDGLALCRQLREQGRQMPILMLTAKDADADVVAGLDAGADDYVFKSSAPTQLLARIRALLRRGGSSAPVTVLVWGDLRLDPVSAQVSYGQKAIALTPKEYKLLELFLRNPQRVFSRSAIIDHLWSIDDSPTESAVTNLIKDLRQKLRAAGISEDLIETVYGLGYRLRERPAEKSPPQQIDTADTPASSSAERRQQDAAMYQAIEQFRQMLQERLTVLEETEAILQVQELSAAQRQTARQEAHGLAGSMGMLGYANGADLSRAIEFLLRGDVPLGETGRSLFSQMLADLKQELTQSPAPVSDALLPLSTPFVLMVDTDLDFAKRLAGEAPAWGIYIDVVTDWTTAQERFAQETPTALLYALPEGATPTTLEQLQSCRNQFPALPILALSDRDVLEDRVAVARLGVERYCPKTLDTNQILEAILAIAKPSAEPLPATQLPKARVLIVDDDAVARETLTHVLEPWGLTVTTLADPSKFWQVLTTVHPDLLILDVEMPTFNGIELCQVVRQDPKYGDLPILVVTGHTGTSAIQQVFAAGADDYIPKPFVGPELVTRVISRIERSRLQKQLRQLRQPGRRREGE